MKRFLDPIKGRGPYKSRGQEGDFYYVTATCDLMQHDCHLYFISVTAQCMAAIFIFVSVTAGQEGFEGVTALWDLIKEYTYISDRRDSTPLRLTII